MTDVMSASPGVDLSTYTYTSEPRAISIRRSHRGSRDLSDLPKWNPYFANARSLSPDQYQSFTYDIQQNPEIRRAEFREKLEARARLKREKHGLSNLYSSNSSMLHRLNLRLDGSNNSQGASQTEGRLGRSMPRVYRPPPGVDAQTQVYQDELEAAGEAAMEEVLLGTLVARTLREAVLEVVLEEQAEESRTTRILQEVTVWPERAKDDETREEPEGKEPSEVGAESEAFAEGGEEATTVDEKGGEEEEAAEEEAAEEEAAEEEAAEEEAAAEEEEAAADGEEAPAEIEPGEEEAATVEDKGGFEDEAAEDEAAEEEAAAEENEDGATEEFADEE